MQAVVYQRRPRLLYSVVYSDFISAQAILLLVGLRYPASGWRLQILQVKPSTSCDDDDDDNIMGKMKKILLIKIRPTMSDSFCRNYVKYCLFFSAIAKDNSRHFKFLSCRMKQFNSILLLITTLSNVSLP